MVMGDSIQLCILNSETNPNNWFNNNCQPSLADYSQGDRKLGINIKCWPNIKVLLANNLS